MAHFAEIDDTDTVLRVLVVPDDQEHRGQDYLAGDLGLGGTWIQTSYNNNIRANYAGIGSTYDRADDVFIPPQPFSDWVLGDDYRWMPPEPKPDGDLWEWDQQNSEWIAAEPIL